MTRDPCCLCGGTDHHPTDCRLKGGLKADPPAPPPPVIPLAEPDPSPYDGDYFCCARMDRALAGPRWTMPEGLTRDQMADYITSCANGEIPPDEAAP